MLQKSYEVKTEKLSKNLELDAYTYVYYTLHSKNDWSLIIFFSFGGRTGEYKNIFQYRNPFYTEPLKNHFVNESIY